MESLNIVFNPTIFFNDVEWTPHATRLMVAKDGNVQEAVFIKLSKWDSKLVQLVTGKCLRFGKDTSTKTSTINVKFFDDIVDMVHTEIRLGTMRAMVDEEEAGERRKKRRVSKRRVTHLTPKTVNVAMPAVGNLPERVVTFKTELKHDLWMELTDANMLHFITGIHECKIPGRKKTKKADGAAQEDEPCDETWDDAWDETWDEAADADELRDEPEAEAEAEVPQEEEDQVPQAEAE